MSTICPCKSYQAAVSEAERLLESGLGEGHPEVAGWFILAEQHRRKSPHVITLSPACPLDTEA